MSRVGQRERATQNRIVTFFQNELGYRYLGDWHDRDGNKNIETSLLTTWLQKRGISDALITRAYASWTPQRHWAKAKNFIMPTRMCIACCAMA